MTCKATRSTRKTSHFHVMVKPIGAICNLDCAYCYYLEKEHLYPDGEQFRMPWKVLKSFIRRYIAAHKHLPEIHFAWQGGEPTLLGLDFFERVVALQRKYQPAGGRVANSIQTNGVLLDDAWGRFLKEQGFLVGISIDGPPELHDRYRAVHPIHPRRQARLANLQCCNASFGGCRTIRALPDHCLRRVALQRRGTSVRPDL